VRARLWSSFLARINIIAEEDKKALCQVLGKLHIPDTVDDDKLRTLKLLMHSLRSVSAVAIETFRMCS
jgi:hypothetical protein